MNDLQKRILLFMGLCIPTRFLIAFIVSKLSKKYLFYTGIGLLLLVINWSYIYLFKTRKIGVETLGEKIWWDWMRPIHIGFYVMAALMCLDGNNNAYIPIVIDTIVGALSFIIHHKLIF
jgi:hypothetical protein